MDSRLLHICTVIESCKWSSHHGKTKKLTKFTADAFVVTTKCNIAAAKRLIEVHTFQYILPAVPLKSFLGKPDNKRVGTFI